MSGLPLAQLSPAAKQQLGIPTNLKGLLVQEVSGGAEQAGIRAGSRSVALGGHSPSLRLEPDPALWLLVGDNFDQHSPLRLVEERDDAQRLTPGRLADATRRRPGRLTAMARTAPVMAAETPVTPAPLRPVMGAGVIALAHAVNDSYAYILPALLPLLLAQAGLTLGTGAALVALQQLASSFLQPVIGHWADRTGGGRWMSWCGLLLSGAGAAALGSAPGFGWLAAAMLINGLGAALFHPVSAALVARAAPPAQRGFWMSAYISAGNLGLGLGPLLVGLVLVQSGLSGTWLLALPAIATGVLIWRLAPARPGRAAAASGSLLSVLRRHWRLLAALVAVVALRSWASTTLTTFLPVLASDRGASPADAAEVLSVFLIAGALGGFAGGAVSDRVGRDRVVIGSLVLSVPCGVSVALMGEFGLAFWVASGASGFFLNGSWIPLTVRGQESVPSSIAMMSGLMLGLSIGLGGVAVPPIGRVAESVGLGEAVAVVACLPLLGALIMWFVPRPGAARAD